AFPFCEFFLTTPHSRKGGAARRQVRPRCTRLKAVGGNRRKNSLERKTTLDEKEMLRRNALIWMVLAHGSFLPSIARGATPQIIAGFSVAVTKLIEPLMRKSNW